MNENGVLVGLTKLDDTKHLSLELSSWKLVVPPGYNVHFFDRIIMNNELDTEKSCHFEHTKICDFIETRGHENIEYNNNSLLKLFLTQERIIDISKIGLKVNDFSITHQTSTGKYRVQPNVEYVFAGQTYIAGLQEQIARKGSKFTVAHSRFDEPTFSENIDRSKLKILTISSSFMLCPASKKDLESEGSATIFSPCPPKPDNQQILNAKYDEDQ